MELHLTAVVVLDSVTKLQADHRSAVVIAASHGGAYSGYLAASAGISAIILNNSGIGKDASGVAALDYLQACGVAAAAVDHFSARIGDGADMMDNGLISHANACALQHGCEPGMRVSQAARLLATLSLAPAKPPTAINESRHALEAGAPVAIIGIDSVSLLSPDDEGALVVTASHGGLLASSGSDSVDVPVRAISFHDAGGGKDDAGYGRLPSLARRGIAAVTVSTDSARIGDASSCYHDGVISRANAPAQRLGAQPGQTLKSFYAALRVNS